MEELLDAPADEPLRRRDATIVSPLRYPGGKRRLVGYIAEALRLNNLKPKLFVEPFAGGANVALQLLHSGLVERIALGERDPLVASFWKVVFWDTNWLIDQIRATRPTLALWDEHRHAQPTTDRERALTCMILNRTSFSGIMNHSAGPIGGRKQESAHRIDCRFAGETVIKRIQRIASLRDKVKFVHEGDWADTIALAEQSIAQKKRLFFYFDPPFYTKADRLYRFFFNQADHDRLHAAVTQLKSDYIVSYDPAERIRTLYTHTKIGLKHIELLYSATQPDKLVKAQELIISNLRQLPHHTRLWMTVNEWRRGPVLDPLPHLDEMIQAPE